MGYPALYKYPADLFTAKSEQDAARGIWDHAAVCLGKHGFRGGLDYYRARGIITGYRESGERKITRAD